MKNLESKMNASIAFLAVIAALALTLSGGSSLLAAVCIVNALVFTAKI